MNRCIRYLINKDYSTIDRFLLDKGYSLNNITRLKKMPVNTVLNGEFVHLSHELKPSDELIINIAEPECSTGIPVSHGELDVIYEDADIIVLNKPSGLPTHPSKGHYEDSLAGRLMGYYHKRNEAFVFRCSNRLDKDTSGIIPVSKNMVSAAVMSKNSAARQIERRYLAICHGHFGEHDQDSHFSENERDMHFNEHEREGMVTSSIIRPDEASIKREAVTNDVNADHGHYDEEILQMGNRKSERAVTHYKVIDELFIDDSPVSFVELKLESGRTHQIRVHMSSIGHPLVGDVLYGGHELDGIAHQALNSYYMSFAHPITAEPMEFTAR